MKGNTTLRRAKSLLWTAFSIVVIVAAVLVGIGKLLMPYSDRYQPRLEAWLSEEFGRPVVLDSFDGEWLTFGPRLTLRGMRLLSPGEDATALEGSAEVDVVIDSAALDIRPLNLLLPGQPLYNFRVIGADFRVQRTEEGELRVSGFGVRPSGREHEGSALRDLVRVGEVVLEDSNLQYSDDRYGVQLNLRGIRGTLRMTGDELASEIRASLYDDRSDLVIGELEGTAILSLGPEQEVVSARWQATTRELMLAALQGRLPPNPFLPLTGSFNAELWGSWSPADGHRVKGATDLREARLVNDYQDLWLDHVNTRFDWQFKSRRNWSLHFADFLFDDGEQAWTAPRLSLARHTADGLGLWISADRLPLGVPLRLARDIMSMYGTPWPAFLPRAVNGEVSEFDLLLDAGWRVDLVRGELHGASVSDWARWPNLEGLSGRIDLHRGTGRIDLHGNEVLVDWPGMFRETLAVTLGSCTVDLDWGDRWQAAIRNCSVANPDLAAHAEILLAGNTGRPAIDANVVLTRARVGHLDPYWPESAMGDNVKAWLRRGLVSGKLESARVSLHGDLDDWPFRGGTGRFEAVAHISDGELDFADGWPHLKKFNAVARFVGASMDIRGQADDLAGVPVAAAGAAIADFATPLLVVDYAGAASLPAMLGFLRRTPLRASMGSDLSEFQWSGDVRTDGQVRVPLGATPGELTVAGRAQLTGGGFADPAAEVVLETVSGQVEYDENGFRGSGLQAEFRGHPARLDLAADAGAAEKFRADLIGEFGIQQVIPAFLLEDFSALAAASGECEWDISVSVRDSADGSGRRAYLGIESGLEGVSLDFPAPLAKPAEERWPMRLDFPLVGADPDAAESGRERVLDLRVADRLVLRLDLPANSGSVRRAVIGLGERMPQLPGAGQIRIEGSTGLLDLDHWVDVVVDEAARGQSMGELTLEPGLLHAQELHFLDRRFADVDLAFSAEGQDIRAEFDGADIQGKLRYTTGSVGMHSMSAEFERLALGEPLSSGVELDTDPAQLPALHLYAHSLKYAGVELGETRIEAFPIANGFRFEKIDASSDQVRLKASGEWLRDAGGQRSDFDINIASESLGDLLHSMDFASPVEGGQTLVTLNAWWPGPPAAFALSRLNGQVEFSVVDGNISSASPGSGRLLGLLSIQALPKRLALDFRDVFDTGFSFDEATGTFNMENGMASTDDVQLRSSAANISVSGRTDLVAREYDQLLTIKPGVGNTLPIIGALAAGPIGAGAGLALQGLLHNELAEATQVQYAVTGHWEDPKFEAVDVVRQRSMDAPPVEAEQKRGNEGP